MKFHKKALYEDTKLFLLMSFGEKPII